MTTYLISHHPGAIEWAARQHMPVDQRMAHLDPAIVQAGDVVIGSLPVNLAAQVRARGGGAGARQPATARLFTGCGIHV